MPITVYCSKCGQKNRAPDHAAGKQGQCSACGHKMPIPSANPASAGTDPADLEAVHPRAAAAALKRELALEGSRKVEATAQAPSALPALTSYLVTLGLAAVCGFWSLKFDISRSPAFTLVMVAAIAGSALLTHILGLIFIYRAWQFLPERLRTISPSAAVLFLIAPILNLYGYFAALHALTLATNRQLESKDAHARVSLRLSMAVCVTFLPYAIAGYINMISAMSQFWTSNPPAPNSLQWVGQAGNIAGFGHWILFAFWLYSMHRALSAQGGKEGQTVAGHAWSATLACVSTITLLSVLSFYFAYAGKWEKPDPISPDPYDAYGAPTPLPRPRAPNIYQPRQFEQPVRKQPRSYDCPACQGSGTSSSSCFSCNGTGHNRIGSKCMSCNGRLFNSCHQCRGKGVIQSSF